MNSERKNFIDFPYHDPERDASEGKEPLPILPIGDFVSIELMGGAYRGFVDNKENTPFHDFWTDRHAYWVPTRAKVLQVCVGTSAISADRGVLMDPNGVFGYAIEFTKSSLTYELIEQASFVLTTKDSNVHLDTLRVEASRLHQAIATLVEESQGQADAAMVAHALQSHISYPFVVEPKGSQHYDALY